MSKARNIADLGTNDVVDTTADGVSITGNITVTGTVDGRDLTTDGTKLDGIASSATANPNAIDNVVEDTTPQLGGNLDTNGNDINFGDNDKAVFGAGSDLQIYHDTVNSVIKDAGTGNLELLGNNLRLKNADATNSYLNGDNGGGVTLYYAGTQKFITTSTGIDVTGTATMDGLTVDGDVTIRKPNPDVHITSDDTGQSDIFFGGATSPEKGRIQYSDNSDFMRLYAGNIKHLELTGNGDISFYEDTGTTAKFFWDASAESLGIGTSSPNSSLDIQALNGEGLRLSNGGTEYATFQGNATTGEVRIGGTYANFYPTFYSGGTERMRIDSSGNVGIGTSSPSAPLTVASTGSEMISLDSSHATKAWVQATAGSGDMWRIGSIASNPQFYIENLQSSNMLFQIGGTERMRIDSSGNVGIGTSSPNAKAEVYGGNLRVALDGASAASFRGVEFSSSGTEIGSLEMEASGGEMRLTSGFSGYGGYSTFYTNGTERMRLDASGNLLVGKTALGGNIVGHQFNSIGAYYGTMDGGAALNINRKTSDGNIATFRKDDVIAGSIGSHNNGTYVYIGAGDTGLVFAPNIDAIIPYNTSINNYRDNAIDLGTSFYRLQDIYASNGTIQTSDFNEKQDIDVLSDAEMRVAQACKGLLRKFRWRDAVAEKGDDARIHFGIIAQDLQAAFEAEGLDAGKYAMFISTTWWETTEEVPAVEAVEATYDEEGNVLTEAVEAKEAYTRTEHYETAEEAPEGAVERTRLGVRYPELLAFIIATL